jgi:hypothetical protein
MGTNMSLTNVDTTCFAMALDTAPGQIQPLANNHHRGRLVVSVKPPLLVHVIALHVLLVEAVQITGIVPELLLESLNFL